MVSKVLISVSDKEDIARFAEGLDSLGIEILATEGTANALMSEGIPVTKIEDITGFGNRLDGKIKTLHPSIHEMIMTGDIGIVVVNLIPLENSETTLEMIDVGGVALLKSGIKSVNDVCVVVNYERYEEILDELKSEGILRKTRFEMAIEACEYIISYENEVKKIIKSNMRL
ncbi:MAG: phosphoribosylaminoimidazolecarboxamide formyltransferase [Halobacteriota archaeon]|nr:phosphoribosylaminoimidazolecarboxamide formyltransferase [Halobacteriota archaeon]